jgi:hypothetical protein
VDSTTMVFSRTKEAMEMRRKWLCFAAGVSLVLMCLTSCRGSINDEIRAQEQATRHAATRRAEREGPLWAEVEATTTAAAEAAATSEVATAIAGVETYEAGATAEAEATANAEAVSSGVCRTPGAWCVVEGGFDEVVGYVADSNEVNISFPVDGGPVSGDFRFSWTYEASDQDGYLCRARIGSVGTLSGDFDPDIAKLEGTVYDFRSTMEVLEGCEEIEVEAYPPTTQWSATYDWSTGGIEGEVVFPDGPTPFHGATVAEEPSNPVD